MNLAPQVVMDADYNQETYSALPRNYRKQGRNRERFHETFFYTETNSAVLTNTDRLVGKDVVIMHMVKNGVTLEYPIECWNYRRQRILTMHQISVRLMLYKRHQHYRADQPGNYLNNNWHSQIHSNWIPSPSICNDDANMVTAAGEKLVNVGESAALAHSVGNSSLYQFFTTLVYIEAALGPRLESTRGWA
jgi:hypothetical protein